MISHQVLAAVLSLILLLSLVGVRRCCGLERWPGAAIVVAGCQSMIISGLATPTTILGRVGRTQCSCGLPTACFLVQQPLSSRPWSRLCAAHRHSPRKDKSERLRFPSCGADRVVATSSTRKSRESPIEMHAWKILLEPGAKIRTTSTAP